MQTGVTQGSDVRRRHEMLSQASQIQSPFSWIPLVQSIFFLEDALKKKRASLGHGVLRLCLFTALQKHEIKKRISYNFEAIYLNDNEVIHYLVKCYTTLKAQDLVVIKQVGCKVP